MTQAAVQPSATVSLDAALSRIAAGAADRDGAPPPVDVRDALGHLRAAGVLAANALPGPERPPAGAELALVRRVAAADGSVGRILDGHLNAVERIAVHAPPSVRDAELGGVRAGARLLGVWGGAPHPAEGPAARLVATGSGKALRGTRTFCSGAGAVDAALVVVADDERGDPVLVLVEITPDAVEIDTGWFRSRGLVGSMSHRVVFHDAPVIAPLGPVTRQPWFARDALRTAAGWAGMADSAFADARRVLRERDGGSAELGALAAGRMLTARHTIDVWLAAAAQAMDQVDPGLAELSLHGRAAIAGACRTLLDEAARACGSHPFVTGSALDRARRDLEVFLLQHRLDPMLARAGARALEAG